LFYRFIPSPQLAVEGEFSTAIALVTLFRLFFASWSLFAERRGCDGRSIDALPEEEFPDAVGAPFAQRQVVFLATAFVGISLDCELQAALQFQPGRARPERRDLIRPYVGLVVIEVNGLHVLAE